MPHVSIKMTQDGTTKQKTARITGASQLLANGLRKHSLTRVIVDDKVGNNNWVIGRESLTIQRREGK
ncbi:tautomerase family protein [Glaciimonas sp. CA11.2]|uniref:hypothetical protein n=1 Tax=unclassified Glaciimonas TaxID=2644401 RepID=UPI002AB35E03|nr:MULTISPECIES: hypothetical protein [unclassified Glaciimonas]MDY7546567.1 hypothetical protein [Glaciimonas sp. CA11.2]MEB0011693.1 tautomerase family protein [Glaciimonas sp. Cout2]MEB0080751.1 tautomerase family protein [Glaciimonas sp. Gout2]MEB0161798.1 tautomerase family protein [Glaciimonas sp. CA11.2]